MIAKAERRACEIRLRAERKAGQLLAKMEKAKAGRPPQNRSSDETDFRGAPTLSDLGVSKSQSSRWQALGRVPTEDFEAALAGDDKPTSSSVKRQLGCPADVPERHRNDTGLRDHRGGAVGRTGLVLRSAEGM